MNEDNEDGADLDYPVSFVLSDLRKKQLINAIHSNLQHFLWPDATEFEHI